MANVVFHADRLLNTIVNGYLADEGYNNAREIKKFDGMEMTYLQLCEKLSVPLSRGNGCPDMLLNEKYLTDKLSRSLRELSHGCIRKCSKCYQHALMHNEMYEAMIRNGVIEPSHHNKDIVFRKKGEA